MTFREIIESDSVQESRDKACLEYARTEDAWLAVTWLLARNPEIGTIIASSKTLRFHKQQGYSITGQPAVHTFYTYDENQVNIVSVKFETEEEESISNEESAKRTPVNAII